MDSSDVPLCGQRLFLYPGNPDGTGIIEYSTEDYRSEFEEIEFVSSSQFIHSLEDDITLRDRSLLEITDGERFQVPEYQRNYSWQSEQHEEFWETAREVLRLETKASDKPSDAYFGTVYIAKSPQRDRYELIDGQQRLATVSIVLKNIAEKIDELLPNVNGQLKAYAEHIRDDYIDELLYRRKGPSEVPFLTLNDHDNEFFMLLFASQRDQARSMVQMDQYDGRKSNAISLRDLLQKFGIDEEVYGPNGLDISEDELNTFRYFGDAHSKLLKADEFYANKLDDLITRKQFSTAESKLKTLLNLTQYILRSLRISECLFETDNQELRIEVFQSLNDRGIELSNMDKVRARIVGRFQGESDSDTQIGRWVNVMEEFGSEAEKVEDFLAHYLAATEPNFSTVTEAKNGLLDAFRLREVGHKEVESRLASPGAARDFLEELEQYAIRYKELIESDLTDDTQQLAEEYREEAESILRRLNGLNRRQWRPFLMYIYQRVLEAPSKGEFFCKVLHTVESIAFRVSISDHVGTVIDDTYPESTQEFIQLEQSNEEFDAGRISEILIENVDSSARQLFGENFADKLISSKNWGNNQVKQLYLKLADEEYRRQSQQGITNTSLSQDTGKVHIEHVFPRSFIQSSKSNPYAWLENFFQKEPETQLSDRIELLKDREVAEMDRDSAEFEEIEPILSRIEESFVCDLGNMILLDKDVNRPVQNRLFSIKVAEYHNNHGKDMDNIANRYFSTSGTLPEQKLSQLLRMDLPDDETDPSVSNIIQEFNQWWHWERAIERKATLVEQILDSLTFHTRKDEFDSVTGKVESMVKDDYSTRFTLLNS